MISFAFEDSIVPDDLRWWVTFSEGECGCEVPLDIEPSSTGDDDGRKTSRFWFSTSWRYSFRLSRAWVRISIRSVRRWNSWRRTMQVEWGTEDDFLPACRRRVEFREMPDYNCSHPPLGVSTFSSDLLRSSCISVDRHHVCPLPLCRISFAENCPRDCSKARQNEVETMTLNQLDDAATRRVPWGLCRSRCLSYGLLEGP